MLKALNPLAIGAMLLALAGCLGRAETPEGEAKRMILAVANQQIAEVVSLFPPDARAEYEAAAPERKQALANTVRMMSQHAAERRGIRELIVLEQRIAGNTASVTIRTVYGNGETATDTLALRRFGSDWCSATAIPF